ncbi:GmrSD restriction endonuclease domain-containing protein [Mycobacterium sp.]|uniref:GmrSD restriction endonuclease domain-containing protein n=1 Tax=Mycobacterium sp. TaxID=1785 RepID=UPI003D0F78E8
MVIAQPSHNNYPDLLSQIENGTIKIPQFQRDFVWTRAKSAALLDSIVKGYPVGTFIFWHTNEQLRTVRSIGNKKFKDKPGGDYFDYVLDGQQRLTSLYAAVKGVAVARANGKVDDFSQMWINLDADEHDDIVTIDRSDEDKTYIALTELLSGQLLTLGTKFNIEYHPKLQRYVNAFTTYSFPVVSVRDAEIDVATEIFTRINVGGKPLTPFEIVVAKTYDERRKFDLANKYGLLKAKLNKHDYDIADMTPLQLIALLAKGDCRRQAILKLDKATVLRLWDPVEDAIEQSVDYFKAVCGVRVSQLLPYGGLAIPFAYFFHKNAGKKPTADQARLLTDFFWRCGIGGRYSSSFESRAAADLAKIDKILKGEAPTYDWPTQVDPEFLLANGRFAPSRAFVKAILCIYASFQPRSFDNNGIVAIANDALKRANSRNYHHFFPLAYLKKIGVSDSRANNLFNITMIDAHLNKNQIRARPPLKYMQEFEKSNPDMSQTLKSHLMPESIWADIQNDDYEHFLVRRAERISKELRKRIIPQEVDSLAQAVDDDTDGDDEVVLDPE